MADYARGVKSLIKKAGWSKIRHRKSSHERWEHGKTGKRITVPSKILSKKTANSVLAQAGCKERV